MRGTSSVVLIVSGLLLSSGPVSAHHSFAAEFDSEKAHHADRNRHEGRMDQSPRLGLYQREGSGHQARSPIGASKWDRRTDSSAAAGGRDTLKMASLLPSGVAGKERRQADDASKVTMTSTGARPGETLDAASSQGGRGDRQPSDQEIPMRYRFLLAAAAALLVPRRCSPWSRTATQEQVARPAGGGAFKSA